MELNLILHFLEKLKENNHRTWFDANRNEYEKTRAVFKDFVEQLLAELQKMDSTLVGLNAKDCIFRIFRDVRFSKNKLPFKTNMGAFMVAGGRNIWKSGYYIHLDPDGCFIGGGIYMPPTSVLQPIRQEIFYNINEFKSIIQHPDFIAQFGSIAGEKLKVAPKGYDKNDPDIELLKFKSYTVMKMLKPEDLEDKNLITNLMVAFSKMSPFNDFLNRSLDNSPSE